MSIFEKKIYTQKDMDKALKEQDQILYAKYYQGGLNSRDNLIYGPSIEREHNTKMITYQLNLMMDRRKEFAIKMIDAIAKGNVEQLIQDWSDPYAFWSGVVYNTK